jgi:hypothetical protein
VNKAAACDPVAMRTQPSAKGKQARAKARVRPAWSDATPAASAPAIAPCQVTLWVSACVNGKEAKLRYRGARVA